MKKLGTNLHESNKVSGGIPYIRIGMIHQQLAKQAGAQPGRPLHCVGPRTFGKN